MSSVKYEQATRVFPKSDQPAVDGLSLTIPDGEFLVLVGPSGCGKSTSLRMLAGLEDVDSGTVHIGERDVTHLPPKSRDVAMVFQSYALYPHMTVHDNLAFGLKLRHVAKADIDRRVKEAADILELGPLLARKPRELSGGQRQRVALGRAIVREPAVFLMDEPLSNLDAKLRVQTRAQIARLHQRLGTTFVYVTHDQVEAMTMGQRIAVMSAAKLQQVGTPQELYDHPANRFVAGFIGSPAMNFIEATVRGSGGQAALVADGIDLAAPAGLPVHDGQAVVAGIRPEHLELVEPTAPHGSVKGTADVVEYLGNEELIHVTSGGHDLIAVVDSSYHVKAGDAITLFAPLEKVHLFDTDAGLAMTAQGAAAVAA